MERFKEIKIYSNDITQSGLEGILLSSDGELVKIDEFGPRNEKGIPQGYVLAFDIRSKSPLYDIVYVNPETDPFGSLERSIMDAHKGLDEFLGRVESTYCGTLERYLIFKRKRDIQRNNIFLFVVISVIISIPLVFYTFPQHYLFAVCLDSIFVYSSSVYFFHYHSLKDSGEKDFDAGQIRRAITTTFIFLFIVTLPLHFPSECFGFLYEKLSNGTEQGALQAQKSFLGLAMHPGKSLDIMILTILGFYFGARVVENAVSLVFRKEKT